MMNCGGWEGGAELFVGSLPPSPSLTSERRRAYYLRAMKTLLPIILIAFTAVTFGQTAQPTLQASAPDGSLAEEKLSPDEANVWAQYKLVEMSNSVCSTPRPVCAKVPGQMAALLSEISKSPRLIRLFAADAMFSYQTYRRDAKSAPQISQLADEQNAVVLPLLVLQNQRIIELLETIAKKK
jgi:hypothetical protein